MQKILNEILKELKPSKQEEKELNKKINNFLKKLNKNLKGAKAILGGSGAKGTWLPGTHDADIFVQFDYKKFSDKSNQLSDILEPILKKTFNNCTRLHGSRDYFQIKEKGFTFEVVPILKITSSKQAKNITDVSPLHALWVKKHRKFADQIRLTKKFCKANGVYGAESYIMGFSGYICEILTIYYKGFENLVKSAARWHPKTIIDPEKYYKNEKDILFHLNKSKLVSPLIIIDPVQPDRNAAAAISIEKYYKFIEACKSFLKNPSKDFFTIKEINEEILRKKSGKNKLIILDVEPIPGKEDVSGSKLLKAFEFIKKNMLENDFKILESGWKWDKSKHAMFWYILDPKPLPDFIERKGPPLKAKKFIDDFKKHHNTTFVKSGRIWAKDKRKFTEPKKLAEFLLKSEYLRDKLKSSRLL